MRVLILDGHPDEARLTSHLLDVYQAALPADAVVERIAVRHLAFDPVLRRGYEVVQAWEPDLERVAAALRDCDHLVIAFPLWWGDEPALLKGLIDRVLLPGFAFRHRPKSALWDRLLAGRSADLLITSDTPSWYLHWVYGAPVLRRWRGQVLGFCGFKPVRALSFGPVREGGAQARLPGWRRRVERLARTANSHRREARRPT